MFDGAAKCPHCGAVQKRERPPLDANDARSLLEIERAAADAQENVRTDLVGSELFPKLRGSKRSFELVLTVLAFPLIVASIFTIGITLAKLGGRGVSNRGAVAAAVPASTFFLYGLLGFYGFPAVPSIALAAMFLCWVARAILRFNDG
jgi:hypothetical protein